MVKRSTERSVHIFIRSIGSMLLLLATSFILPFASVHGSDSSSNYTQHTIIPQTSNDVLLNPGKGWVLYGSPSDQDASTMGILLMTDSFGIDRMDYSLFYPQRGLHCT